jgi:hypothetical protein
MLASTSCNGLSLGVAKDAGVKEMKDLKGKRVGFVVGSPALNQNALAIIAYGGLTRDDVKIVEFSNYGAMWKGMVNNEVGRGVRVHHLRPGARGGFLAARPDVAARTGRRQSGLGARACRGPVLLSRTRPSVAPVV